MFHTHPQQQIKKGTFKGRVVAAQAVKAYGGSGSLELPILNLSTRWQVSSQLYASAEIPLGKIPRCPQNGRLGPTAGLGAVENS